MRDAKLIAIGVVGILAPILLTLWIHSSKSAALLIVSAPWLNWSIYVIGCLLAALLATLGSYILRSYGLLVAAQGGLYWAIGCMVGGLQAGTNPAITPDIALPYIRGFWLLGSVMLIVSTLAVFKAVVHIRIPEDLSELDTEYSIGGN